MTDQPEVPLRAGQAAAWADSTKIHVVFGVTLLATGIVCLPIFFPQTFAPEAAFKGLTAEYFRTMLLALPVVVLWCCYRLASTLPPARRVGLLIFLAGTTFVLN